MKYDIKEKGLSADEVYDRATWRHMSSYINKNMNVGIRWEENKKTSYVVCTQQNRELCISQASQAVMFTFIVVSSFHPLVSRMQ